MPGPGPRGPRQTYRTPCSSIFDPRILPRNPRKTGKSRRARGTRTRQPGTRSTRDGLLCGEIASAAGEQRPSILDPPASILDPRRLHIEIALPSRDPRRVHRPRTRPVPTSSTREPFFLPFFVLFAQNCQKTAEPGPRIWSEFSAKNRELAEIRQFCQNFFRIEARVAPAAERNPAHGPPDRAGAPAYRVRSVALDHRIRARDPPGPHAPSRLQGPCF